MNWIGFIGLIREIYGKRVPNVDRIERMGLLAVKIGQIHALRVDLLDEAKCRELARLYRHNRPAAPVQFRRLLDASAAAGFRDSFSSIDEEPLAVASIGQVHAGVLKSGERVVVKVVKEGQRDAFIRDITSLKRFAATLMFLYPTLRRVANPLGLIADIETYTLSELDLVHEVQGQHQLRDILARAGTGIDLSRLRFPKLHENLSNDRVLVSERIEGKTFDERLDDGTLDYDLLLELFHIHGYFMFIAGVFHGDLHPGNIIVADNAFYFIDTGYIGVVNTRIRENLLEFFDALSAYDFDRCADRLHDMSDVRIPDAAYRAFRERFFKLYHDFKGRSVSEVSLTRQMMNTIKLGVRSGMEFGQGVFPIIRSLMYLDGMVLRCRPDARLLEDMRPAIARFRAAGVSPSVVTPSAPAAGAEARHA